MSSLIQFTVWVGNQWSANQQKLQGGILIDNIFTNIMIKIQVSMEENISPLMQNCCLKEEDGDKGYDTSIEIYI